MDLKENLTGLEHVGVPTKDLAKTIAFYESIGFAVILRTATPDGVPVAFLQLGNVVIETYESAEPGGQARRHRPFGPEGARYRGRVCFREGAGL